MLGIAIASSSPSVAARCAYAWAGVGVCATQNITDPRLGPRGLALLRKRLAPRDALERLRAGTDHAEYRQVGLLDRDGVSACFSGAHSLGIHAGVQGRNAVALGNLLANADVPGRMVDVFGECGGHIGDRLLKALHTGLITGGEAGPIHSAGLLLVDRVPWPVADLRIDWHDMDPIGELERLWSLWQPQMADYVARALDPAASPAFGVAGDP